MNHELVNKHVSHNNGSYSRKRTKFILSWTKKPGLIFLLVYKYYNHNGNNLQTMDEWIYNCFWIDRYNVIAKSIREHLPENLSLCLNKLISFVLYRMNVIEHIVYWLFTVILVQRIIQGLLSFWVWQLGEGWGEGGDSRPFWVGMCRW